MPDAVEDLRVRLFHPRVLSGLRACEAVIGVLVHQLQRRGEGARALAAGFAQRPQPRRIDVRVANGRDHVVGGARPREDARKLRRIIAPREPLQRVAELVSLVAVRQRGHELVQHLEIQRHLPRRRILDPQLRLVEDKSRFG